MNMNFDISKVFQAKLASSMGLDNYRHIMLQVHRTNISTDTDFQKTFNYFYKVRRNESWRKIYYDYFESIKYSSPSFSQIITYLYDRTGNIEPSFSSKMLASILHDSPIWDQYVLQNLNLQLTGKTQEEKLKNAITIYSDIKKWYQDFLQSDKALEWLNTFDSMLPDYKWLSAVKKIDFILWSIR